MRVRNLTSNLLYGLISLVEAFLALRFILKLFGANAGNAFVEWAYEMSSVLLEPFRGIFPTTVFKSSFVIEFSTLFAMVIYGVVALLVFALIDMLVGVTVKSKK